MWENTTNTMIVVWHGWLQALLNSELRLSARLQRSSASPASTHQCSHRLAAFFLLLLSRDLTLLFHGTVLRLHSRHLLGLAGTVHD